MGSPASNTQLPYFLQLCGLGLGLLAAGCVNVTRSNPPALIVSEPSRAEPVTSAMQAARPAVSAGETFRLLVRLRIAGGHYIYKYDI
jgi:hypothetical protein